MTLILLYGESAALRANRGQEHMVTRAENYIRQLRQKRVEILVPTPVVAEYLVGADATDRSERRILQQGFRIVPFDMPAAEIAADLQRDRDHLNETRKEFVVGRDTVKTDIMIIAVAIYRKAHRIITHDKDLFRALARDKIPVDELPEIPDDPQIQQQTMFGE